MEEKNVTTTGTVETPAESAAAPDAAETALPSENTETAPDFGGEGPSDGVADAEREEDAWRERIILPEGWTPDEDLFSGQQTDGGSPSASSPTGESGGTPPEGDSASGEAGTTQEEAPLPEGGPLPEDEKPDYEALYKAMVQSQRDEQDKATFRKVYQEELDSGMSERWARTAAANAVGGRTFPLTDEPGASAADTESAAAAAVKQISTLYPDAKEIPSEVAQKVKEGVDLVSAYGAYRTAQDARTIQALRTENQQLRRQLENTVKAPPQGVSGGASHSEDLDDFMRGFMRGYD